MKHFSDEELSKIVQEAWSENRSLRTVIEELKKGNTKLSLGRVKEISQLQQSYRKQFEWIAQNYPEVYKQIPPDTALDYGFITRNEAQRIQAENEKIYMEAIEELRKENERLKKEGFGEIINASLNEKQILLIESVKKAEEPNLSNEERLRRIKMASGLRYAIGAEKDYAKIHKYLHSKRIGMAGQNVVGCLIAENERLLSLMPKAFEAGREYQYTYNTYTLGYILKPSPDFNKWSKDNNIYDTSKDKK